MFFHDVIEYGKQNGLGDGDFEFKKIHWLIQLDENGKVSGPPIPNTDEVEIGVKGKTKKVVTVMSVPYTDANKLNCSPKEYYFLYGRLGVLLGDKSEEQKDFFVKLLADVCPGNPQLLALKKFIRSKREVEKSLNQLLEMKAKPVENISFMVNGKILLRNEVIRTGWRKFRQQYYPDNGVPQFCHLSGEMKPCVDKLTKVFIPKLGALNPVGLAKNCFGHFGEDTLTVGINENVWFRGGLYELAQNGIMSGDILYIFFSKEKIQEPLTLDLFSKTHDPDYIKRLLRSPLTGKDSVLGTVSNTYYFYGISVNSERMSVVESHCLSAQKLEENLKCWFGKMGDKPLSIFSLLNGLKQRSDTESFTSHLERNFFRRLLLSALLDIPISDDILNLALELEMKQQMLGKEIWNEARQCLFKLGGLVNENLDAYRVGQKIGLFINLNQLALVSAGNNGSGNTVRSMLNGVYFSPRLSYQEIQERFEILRESYTKKINEKWKGRGTEIYQEIHDLVVNVPEQFVSNEEKASFLMGMIFVTKNEKNN